MAQLLVRGLDEAVVDGLKGRAKANGRSVEAEHRAILEEAVGPVPTTQDMIEAIQSMTWLAELDPKELRDEHDLGRVFDYDPVNGTTVRYVRRAPRHDGDH